MRNLGSAAAVVTCLVLVGCGHSSTTHTASGARSSTGPASQASSPLATVSGAATDASASPPTASDAPPASSSVDGVAELTPDSTSAAGAPSSPATAAPSPIANPPAAVTPPAGGPPGPPPAAPAPPAPSAPPAPLVVPPAPALPAAAGISISNLTFNPPSVHVAIGGTVTVANNDGMKHTWTANAGQPDTWDSGILVGGAAFTHVFGAAGTFSYHCTIHPFMTGNVVVG